MGKGPFSFRRPSIRRRRPKSTAAPQLPKPIPTTGAVASSSSPPPPSTGNLIGGGGGVVAAGKGKKKAAGARLWMRFDAMGVSELVEYDKSTIIKRASIPARDLRILGPVFSHSSTILGMFKLLFSLKFFCEFAFNGFRVVTVSLSFDFRFLAS